MFRCVSLQQCTENDYANKQKIKKHNAASKKLKSVQEEMKHNVGEDVMDMLLNHEDDRVKVNAAAFCLQSGILIDQAVITLKKIIDMSDDSTICFGAKMLLQEH